MKKSIFTLFYFLFLTYYSHTIVQCMELDDDMELSKNYSLISGSRIFNTYTDDNGKHVAITLGITKDEIKSGIWRHAYLAFEYYDENKHIKLEGTEMSRETGISMVRSHQEVIRDFVGYNEKTKKSNPQKSIYRKHMSFIVLKKDAEIALRFAKTINGTYALMGGDEKKKYNCCTYVTRLLKEAGMKLEEEWYFYTDTNNLIKITNTFCATFQDLTKNSWVYGNVRTASELLEEASKAEKKRIEEETEKKRIEEEEQAARKLRLKQQQENADWWKKTIGISTGVGLSIGVVSYLASLWLW